MARIYNNKGSEDTLLPYINRGYARYVNGTYGEIYVDTDYKIWFKPMKLIDGVTYESKEPHHYLGRGFIAYYIINDGLDTIDVFQTYLDMTIKKYIGVHKKDVSAWKKHTTNDWIAEYLPIHIKEENDYNEECDELFTYLPKKDKENITDFYCSYREWLYSNPLYKPDKYFMLNVLNLDAFWTDEKKDILLKAISIGYAEIDGTHLKWEKLSKPLLAYFLGKLFAGDKIKCNGADQIKEWIHSGALPLNSLVMLFDYPNIGVLRNKATSAPPKYENIDKLF